MTATYDGWTIPGALASGTAAGIKASGKEDVALIAFPDGAAWGAVLTRHELRAAPVRYLEKLRAADPRKPLRLIVINSGNANACTGPKGPEAVTATVRAAALAADVAPDEVAVSSTGVIGVELPVHKLKGALPHLRAGLSATGWDAAARAICTTDATPKLAYRPIVNAAGGVIAHVGGIAKGAGMIAPNMATLLGYVVTDLTLTPAQIDVALKTAVNASFNRITVDGDRSTNDTVLLAATGKATVAIDDTVLAAFQMALDEVCLELAKMIVTDGEGARRVAEISVSGALTDDDALRVARGVANSPLVKTAIYGGDPNWGRIAAAAGAVGVPMLEETLVIKIGDVTMFDRGNLPAPGSERAAAAVLAGSWVPITLRIGKGPGKATVWASDLGHEYVTCNADYRT